MLIMTCFSVEFNRSYLCRNKRMHSNDQVQNGWSSHSCLGIIQLAPLPPPPPPKKKTLETEHISPDLVPSIPMLFLRDFFAPILWGIIDVPAMYQNNSLETVAASPYPAASSGVLL